jgi:MinD superfamily P-loop ATPase
LFIHPVWDRNETVTASVPKIDFNKCTVCGKCGELCEFKAIVVVGETVLSFEELCHSCGGCMAVCPEGAITEKGRELGVIQRGHCNGIEFIHGKLRVGEAMSPPLIKAVLSFRDPTKLTIVDAPPGTSCPVIETLKPADFVLLVTEPTPFGLYDLKLAVGAAKILDAPCGLVINRSDMGDQTIKAYAAKENLPILMQIPFDQRIAEAYSRGDMIVDVMPAWKPKFRKLFEKIKSQLN